MRFRTGRFEILRSRQPGRSQSVKVRNGQHALDDTITVAPPAEAVARHLFAGEITRKRIESHRLAALGLEKYDHVLVFEGWGHRAGKLCTPLVFHLSVRRG